MILRIDDLIAARGALEAVDKDDNLDDSGMPLWVQWAVWVECLQ